MRSQLRYLLLGISLTFVAGSVYAQFAVSTANKVDACLPSNNGSIDIVIVNSPGASLTDVFGPTAFNDLPGPAGNKTHSISGLAPGNYLAVVTSGAAFVFTPFTILGQPPLTFATPTVVTNNNDCTSLPGNGSIALDVAGGSGSYTYTWTGPVAVGNVSTATGLSKGTYSVVIDDNNSNCTLSGGPFVVSDPGPLPFTISSLDLSICEGEDFELTIDDTDLTIGGSAVTYNVFEGAVNVGTLPDWPGTGDGSAQTLTVSGLAAGVHTLVVRAQATQCGPVQSTNSLAVTVSPLPTITLGANPAVCPGVTPANLTYSATTANQYKLDFDATALGQGFANVAFTALAAAPSQIGIIVPGAAVPATYNATLTLRIAATGCTSSFPVTVTINPTPTITLDFTDPEVCVGGTSVDLTYSATTATPDQYSLDFDATAQGQLFADVTNAPLTASPIVITVPAAAAVGIYNAILTVRMASAGCPSVNMPITVEVKSTPIESLGANPVVCSGVVASSITYSTSAGTPDQYSIDFDAAAQLQLFADVPLTALPASPLPITIPIAAAPGLYNATLRFRDSGTNCFSDYPITVTINPLPTITGVVNPAVCLGATTASLTYGGTTDNPDQYSIDFDAAAQLAGFVDVNNGALTPPTAISITIPGTATPATYNATLTVRSSTTGCVSPVAVPIQVTVNPNADLTPGPNPSVCVGVTTANLTYAGATGGANQYSLNFDLPAEAQGFADVPMTGLPASPIGIAVPVAALPGVYNATLRVSSSVTGCFTDHAITVTVVVNPTITLGANPQQCPGVTPANLTYSATTANEYKLDFDATALGQGFVNVGFTALAAAPSQIAIVVPGAAVPATYNATLTIRTTATGCTSSFPVTVTINPTPTITLDFTDPNLCSGGTSVDLTYSATTGTPNQYSLDFDVTAQGQLFADVNNAALTGSPITITVPAGAAIGIYNAILTVRNSVTGCVSINMPITVEVNINPTITLGASPFVCEGVTTANLPYTATTGSPDQYTIDFDAVAEGLGFVDVGITALPVTPIGVPVPASAPLGVYNASITMFNSSTGCFGVPSFFTVTVGIDVTLGAISPVCMNTNAIIPYSAPHGSPNRFSIDYDAVAEAAGFVDVVNAPLLPATITATVPAGVAGIFNGILTVNNSASGCVSTPKPISLVIGTTITLGPDPSVCFSSTSADLTYTLTTGAPDQYSIDFDATAQGQLFVDVTNAALTGSPIVIAVPAAAAVGVYNAILTVRNSATGCVSVNMPITVQVDTKPTIALGASPFVCEGVTTANLPYTATTGSPDQYTIDFDAAANALGFADVPATALPLTPIGVPLPAAAPLGVYNATIMVFNSATGCVGDLNAFTVTVGIDITAGAVSPVCMNTNAIVPYSAPHGNPDRFSIDFDATAEAAGFVDVVNAPLLPANIDVTVPPGAAGIFNGILTVDNSATGCVSTPKPITIQVGTTVTVGPDPAICIASTSADLTYTATTGSPDEYSIDFDAAAQAVGFADVTNAALTASPLVIVVPAGVPVAVYNYTLTVRNSTSGCVSPVIAMTLSVDASATAAAGADETICAGISYFLAGSSVGGPATTSAWSITSQPAGGDGVLSSTALVADPSTISFSATVTGDYVLTLTTEDPAGTCLPVQDDVTITITPIPVIATGQAKTICGNDDVAYEILLTPANFPPTTLFNWPDPDGTGPATAGVNVPTGVAGTLHINDRMVNVGLADMLVTYVVTPSLGLCVGTPENIDITVRPTPALQLLQTKTICSGDNVNYEVLLNAPNTPPGTKLSWPDPDGTGPGTSKLDIDADPAGTLHIMDTLYNGSGSDIHVIYEIIATAPNGCRAVPRDVDITVTSGAIVNAGAAQSICSTGTATLSGSSIGGLAVDGTWSIVSGPAGGDGVLSLTTPTATPDVVTFTASVPGTYRLRLTSDDPAGTCIQATDDVVITVRDVTDPSCAGGTVGTGTCANVVITPVPSPATCSNSDGSIVFNINPLVPAVNNTGVRIDIVGTGPTNQTISRTLFNDVTFPALPFGGYNYTIEYGDPSCIKTGQVTIDRSGTVGVPLFSNPVDPICFGLPSGQVTIDVPGESGNPLEWSIDGTTWTSFIAGNTVTGIPGGSNTISVRRTSADACASGAMLTLADPTEIVTTLTPTPATCANNDGSITIVPVTGGTFPYTYELNGLAVTPVSDMISGLTAGAYSLVVTDALGCNRTFPTTVTFPGYVNHTAPVVTPPDCTGGGANGIIFVQITDAGNFEFGITTDPILEPATYSAVGGTDIVINNLANGTYFLWIRAVAGTQCITKISSIAVSGTYPVAQQATNTNLVCFSGKATIELTNMTGAPAIDYTYELTNTGTNVVTTGSITAGQALTTFTLNGIDPGNYSVRLLQDQSSIAPACTAAISSTPTLLVINGPTAELDTLAVVRKISYPDLATGTARVEIVASGMEPYQTRMELTMPLTPGQEFIQDWTNIDFNPQSLQFEYTYQNLYAGAYELRLIDAMGCEKIYDISIGVDTDVMIPNIFTPNGDGVNEIFYIRNLPSDSRLVLTNRWGKEVFHSNSYSNDWNGADIVDGIYFYQLVMPDKAVTGWVEINRGY